MESSISTIEEVRENIKNNYSYYYDFLYKIAIKFTNDSYLAEDLVSDVMTKVWVKENIVFKDEVNVKGWLRRILTNDYFSQYKKNKDKIIIPLDITPVDSYKTYSEDLLNGTSPLTYLTTDENESTETLTIKQDLVELCLSKLDETEQEYFNLFFIEGYSYNQLITHFDSTLDNIRNKIFFLRKKLKKVLTEINYPIDYK